MPIPMMLKAGGEMIHRYWALCFGVAWLYCADAAASQVDETSIPELLKQIGGDDQAVSERAATALDRRDPASLTQADIDALVLAIGHEKEVVQEAAVWRLLEIRDPSDKLVLDQVYDKRPKVTKKSKPQYPEEARRRRIRGRVVLQFAVNNAGRVGYVRVLRSIPDLDKAAVQCIREWEFEPAIYGNRPAPFIMMESIDF